MNHVPPRSWAPAQHDLSLPRWAFVAWLTHRRQADGPRPALLAPAGDIEASLRARLLREVAPQA
jgi:hypothetical protein